MNYAQTFEEFLAHRDSIAVSLSDAVAGCLDGKRSANLRPVYVKELRRYLSRFSEYVGDCSIQSVSVSHVEKWLSKPEWSPGTRATGISRLSALFGFAVRRGYILQNPIDRLDRIRLERKPPQILSPSDAVKLLGISTLFAPSMLPYLIVGMFGGVRPHELDKLRFEDIDFKRGIIRIDAATSKVRCRRIVELQPNVIALLSRHSAGTGLISPKQKRRKLRLLREKMGWKSWPKDILRHTASSYLMAKCRDTALVSDWLGNSPGILLTHYRELVSAEDCLAFWKIIP